MVTMNGKQKWLPALLCVLLLGLSACGSDYSDDDPQGSSPLTPAGGTASPQRPAEQTLSMGIDADHPALRNKEGTTGKNRDTGITVMNGDRVEIKPVALIQEQRQAIPPSTSRVDHNACTQTAQVCALSLPNFENRCENQCSVCLKCALFVACVPWQCCDTVCHSVYTGDRCVFTLPQCVQHLNQWVETSTFVGLDLPKTVKDPAPMKSAALLLAGLNLRFSFTDPSGSPQHADCPLGQFKPDADAEKFTLALHNVDGCPQVFVDGAKSQPTLSLVNGMDIPVPYSQGSLVTTWDGRVLEQPQTATYLPVIDFLGTVSVFAAPAK
jgi:hypothetical protein